MPATRDFWVRFGLGAALIVLSVAAATAAAGLVVLEDVAEGVAPIPGIAAEELPAVEPGDPYTLLLLGSDRRPDEPEERADTTMLVRLDPDRGAVSMLSLPRDLRVEIPGHGRDRLNAAYTMGGPRLTLRAVELLTGLEVNEVVDTDFQGFADAVTAVGCVYVDVDRRYFNPPGTGFAEISVNAGYQRLCGLRALQYVRYRHTDNDIVRAARQQAFLREARQRVSVADLVLGGGGRRLIEAFLDNTRSTIQGAGEVRGIARTLFDLRAATPLQIQIEGDLGEDYIAVRRAEIRRAVKRFLGGGEQSGTGAGGSASSSGRESRRPGHEPNRGDERQAGRGRLQAAGDEVGSFAREAARELRIPVLYPETVARGSAFSADSRTYEYRNEDDRFERGYKLVLTNPHPSIAIEYYGVTGTTWDDPPILRNPTEIRRIDGRECLLFYDGGRLRLVGWKQAGGPYWVSSSLLNSLSERQMLAIATSMRRAYASGAGRG